VSRYRDSSGDTMGNLAPRLRAALGADVWQEHNCPPVSAIYLRCTSSVWWLSSTRRQAIVMAWRFSVGACGHAYCRGSYFCPPLHTGHRYV